MPAKSKCTPELIQDVYNLIVQGRRDIDICKTVGISQTQFYAWQDPEHDAFNTAFTESVALARAVLRKSRLESAVHSLYEVATGYDAEESKTDVATDRKTGKVFVKNKTTYKKHVTPNVQALQFLLSNLDPEHWKNKQNTEITGRDGKDLIQKTEINLDALTPEQKATLLSLGEEILRNRETNAEA